MRMVNVQWLMDNAIFNDILEGETKWSMFAEKLDSISWPFVDSIIKNGIRAGVVYDEGTKTFYNGHHRFLIAYLLGIEEIPVFDPKEDDWESTSDVGLEMKGWPSARGYGWGNI